MHQTQIIGPGGDRLYRLHARDQSGPVQSQHDGQQTLGPLGMRKPRVVAEEIRVVNPPDTHPHHASSSRDVSATGDLDSPSLNACSLDGSSAMRA